MNTTMTATETLNRAGSETYRRSLEEQLLQVLTTNTMGNTFYASQSEISAETIAVLCRGASEQPEFLARALVYARSRALLKTVPVIGLVALSTARDKQWFRRVFDRVILIPDDLRTFVQWCDSGKIKGRKGFGGCVVEPTRSWLGQMSEYHAVKYGSDASKDFTLRDLIRLAHPKSSDYAVTERLGWLTRGWKTIGPQESPTNPKIWGLERLKRTTGDVSEITSLIDTYGLPYEVVVPSLKATTTQTWEALMRKAPYMNLLRSLNTYARHGVFASKDNVQYAASRIADPAAVRKSKILPLRFLSAFEAYTKTVGHERLIAEALSTALDLSFANMPAFPQGTTIAVSPDVSGSMQTPIHSAPGQKQSEATCVDVASIFAAALVKAEPNALLLPVDTGLHSVQYSASDSMMSIARKIASIGGGGTSLALPVQHLLGRKIKVDVYIGLTDNEDWAHGDSWTARYGFYETWKQYLRDVNPNAKAFLITLACYRDSVVPASERSAHFIYGWSEAVVGYIPKIYAGGQSQLAEVDGILL